MAWTEISISVASEATALAEVALEQLGALAITLQDDEDTRCWNPGPGATPLWPTVQVRGLFEAGVDRAAVLAVLQTVSGVSTGPATSAGGKWVTRTGSGRGWIVSSRCSSAGAVDCAERDEIPSDPENIEIHLDPGLAFGTGTHPTTALCLEWLDGQDVKAWTWSITAAAPASWPLPRHCKGRSGSICVDNDPQALEATADNAARNDRSHGLIECHGTCRRTSVPAADVVMANILAASADRTGSRCLLGVCFARTGRLALSGILAGTGGCSGLAASTSAGLIGVTMEMQVRDDWVLLQGRRSAAQASGPGAVAVSVVRTPLPAG